MKFQKEIVPIIPSKSMIVGEENAPINIVMFGDYESQATASANKVITELLDQFEGKVNFNFRHFPLTRIHQKAHKAAEAAIGAGQEGKFWEMHQYLFDHRSNLGMISLKSYAREVGVKDKRFLEHLMNSDYGWFVQDDLKEGLNLGVTEIPAVFINKIRFTKDINLKNLKNYIEDHLKESNNLIKRRA
ncbi:MAG: DsbA family protein [Flavisolibacter sp.]